MKTLFSFLLVVFVLANPLYSQDEPSVILVRKGNKVFKETGERVSARELKSILNSYPASASHLSKANTNYTVGSVLMGGAVVCMAINLVLEIDRTSQANQGKIKSSDPTFLLVGSGLMLASLPFIISGSSQSKKAVDRYILDQKKQSLNNQGFYLQFKGNEIGICYKF